MNQILVIGGGAWGSALSNVLSENAGVDLFVNDPAILNQINSTHHNSNYFDQQLNNNIIAIDNYNNISNYQLIVLAVPTGAIKEVVTTLKTLNLNKDVIICNSAKGLIPDSATFISQFLKSELPNCQIASILGPGFAQEVIAKELTAINAVAFEEEVAKKVQRYFANDYFRVYTSTDFIGAEICTALKNVIAIGAGILAGLNKGQNSRAALITRGLKEMIDYGLHFGANLQTFAGLCGIGDLVITCSSPSSRNYALGVKIGQTGNAKFLQNYKYTVEGVSSAKVIYENKPAGIDMPILTAVYNILFHQAETANEIRCLMERSLKPEFN